MTPTNVFFEERVEQLFDLARLLEMLCREAGVDYRIVGGLAAYLYVESREPSAGRLTRDIDILIRREALGRLASVAPQFGLQHRHVAGVDMLVSQENPSARRGIHIVLSGERVREEYLEASPEIGDAIHFGELRVVRLEDLLRMEVMSFQAKNETHLKDLDEAGLISEDLERCLPETLRNRLHQMRERE